MTPIDIVDRARKVLCPNEGETFDLDPASDEFANQAIRAHWFFTAEDDGLSKEWNVNLGTESDPCTVPSIVFLNPPGGKTSTNESQQKVFWRKLVTEYTQGRVKSAFFVCFSLELFQTTQVGNPDNLPLPLDFPFCIPSRRVAYDLQIEGAHGVDVRKKGTSPPHSSAFILLPSCYDEVERFERLFGDAAPPTAQHPKAEYRGRVVGLRTPGVAPWNR